MALKSSNPYSVVNLPTRKRRLYIYMKYEYLGNIIRRDEIKVVRPEDCNDPMEFTMIGSSSPVGDNVHGMICFTEDPCNNAMWAHYADKHKGICLEFQFDEICKNYLEGKPNLKPQLNYNTVRITGHFTKCLLYAATYERLDAKRGYLYVFPAILASVIYSDQKPINMGYDIYPLFNEENPSLSILELSPHVRTKSREWEYEKEHRFFFRAVRDTIVRDGIYFVTDLTKYITRIILGMRFDGSYNDVHRMLEAANADRDEPLQVLPSIARAYTSPDDERLQIRIIDYNR